MSKLDLPYFSRSMPPNKCCQQIIKITWLNTIGWCQCWSSRNPRNIWLGDTTSSKLKATTVLRLFTFTYHFCHQKLYQGSSVLQPSWSDTNTLVLDQFPQQKLYLLTGLWSKLLAVLVSGGVFGVNVYSICPSGLFCLWGSVVTTDAGTVIALCRKLESVLGCAPFGLRTLESGGRISSSSWSVSLGGCWNCLVSNWLAIMTARSMSSSLSSDCCPCCGWETLSRGTTWRFLAL